MTVSTVEWRNICAVLSSSGRGDDANALQCHLQLGGAAPPLPHPRSMHALDTIADTRAWEHMPSSACATRECDSYALVILHGTFAACTSMKHFATFPANSRLRWAPRCTNVSKPRQEAWAMLALYHPHAVLYSHALPALSLGLVFRRFQVL